MTAADVTSAFAATLVDEWARAGVTNAVVSPGSRNTPLVLALARDGRFTVDVVLDERSAAFRALGIGIASGTPAVVCCTSGTAAANLHPAVVEAHHARVPMLVCTADRPPELRDCGAGQTIDQTHLFGHAVRWFHDPGPPAGGPDAATQWRTLACRALAHTRARPRGPVHLNLPFREPLVPSAPASATPGRPGGEPWVQSIPAAPPAPGRAGIRELAGLVRGHARGLLVAGWGAGVEAEVATRFAAAAGWPILADPLSNVRTGPFAISTYEALLRAERFVDAHRPELVLQVGAPLTSKRAGEVLAGIPAVLVDPDGTWLDPARHAAQHVHGEAEPVLRALADELGPVDSDGRPWLDEWRAAEYTARHAIDDELDHAATPAEGRIARDLAAALADGSTLAVGSSLPVRALEWCMAPRAGLRIVANRGANGIDGFVSTARGIARRSAGTTVALCGDLCFLHDTNGLLGLERDEQLKIVVVDNDGGGIFGFLPQHGLSEFERYFATPHGVDLVAVARAHGTAAERLTDVRDWRSIVASDIDVVVVPVDREASIDAHRRLWDVAATALAAGERVTSIGV